MICVDPGGLRRVWKGQGGSIRSGMVREDPEGSLRFRKGPGWSGRIKEGLVGLGRVWKGQTGPEGPVGSWMLLQGPGRSF